MLKIYEVKFTQIIKCMAQNSDNVWSYKKYSTIVNISRTGYIAFMYVFTLYLCHRQDVTQGQSFLSGFTDGFEFRVFLLDWLPW